MLGCSWEVPKRPGGKALGTGLWPPQEGSTPAVGSSSPPPPSSPRAGVCTPRGGCIPGRAAMPPCPAPSRYAARPRASPASRAGGSASPPTLAGGGISASGHPHSSALRSVPPSRKPLPAYPWLSCGPLSSPGPPRQETVSPSAGSWRARDGDTE